MSILYPEKTEPVSGLKSYWGSLYGSAKALALIDFVQKKQERVLLYIANDISQYESILRDLKFYNQSLNILSFPDWEILVYDNFSPHPDIVSARIKTLSELSKLKKIIVVTTLESVLQRISPTDYIEKYSLHIKCGDELIIQEFINNIIKIGYNRVSNVVEQGEFSIKGSLIDIYSMGCKNPYRIDLFDDEIDSIRTFSVSNQLSIKNIESFFILPVREFASDDNSIKKFQTKYQQEFVKNHGIILDELLAGNLPGGIEFYLPLFFDKTSTIFDYLVDDCIIAYEDNLVNYVNEIAKGHQQRYQMCKDSATRPILDLAKIFLRKEEFFSLISARKQIQIQSIKSSKKQVINFNTKLLPPFKIQSQNKQPLNKIIKFIQNFKGKVLFVFESMGAQSIIIDLFKENELQLEEVQSFADFLTKKSALCVINATLDNSLLTEDIAIINEQDLFGSDLVKQKRRRRAKHKDFDESISSLLEIKIGDAIVHENYGVGRYLGLKVENFDGYAQDFISIKYANNAKLMVPVTSLHLISRYSGAKVDFAPLNKLGSMQWKNAKKKASESIYDVAVELLEIHAKRQSMSGFAYPQPSDAYTSFVNSFVFEQTPDQEKTMQEILADMCSEVPMDRLLCGDVGFGKTEIAMRATFLAVEAGKQVAILVPTTLLARQHHQTFTDRFANYPVIIKSISRLQTTKQQTTIKKELEQGKIDIIIGTQKLIQNSIKYKNLGFIVIDEEHRFGVKQKEALKKIRGQSDILTMTSTPIPRTLNMALGSLREFSIISTPPAGRMAIQTSVDEYNTQTIIEACARELHRSGQIFFIHNEIDTIDKIAEEIKELMPNINVRIAHGKMPSKELEHIMIDFYHQRFQLLVCTTIIETGIDIPSANTIIINNAQNFGLAQLHQLRGRVGRSHHKAYAYLMIKSYQALTKDAKKRLEAITALKDLGAGFMLASHDLEIRGAGDLLGENQSGKISEIGFNLYYDLLKRTVKALKAGDKIKIEDLTIEPIDIDTGIACIIPQDYVYDVHERLVLYKRISNVSDEQHLDELQMEIIDRFGMLPDSSKNLFYLTRLRFICQDIGVNKIVITDTKTNITLKDKNKIDPAKIINLIQTQPSKYKLKGQNTLIFIADMENDYSRIVVVSNFLKKLSA